MKRKPSQELMGVFPSAKEAVRRLKSPQNKRPQLQREQEIGSVILHRQKPLKSKEETKGDSNNTTATNKSKSMRLIKKGKEKGPGKLGGL
jgi:hypothetical protein